MKSPQDRKKAVLSWDATGSTKRILESGVSGVIIIQKKAVSVSPKR